MSSHYPKTNFNIVLVEPQIPNNTGNIGRTCVASFSHLHLVKPLGFEIDDKRVRRAGLDYWPELDLTVHESIDDWLNQVEDPTRMFFFSARAEKSFYQTELKEGDWLIFGREADGLPEEIMKKFADQTVTLPFPGKVRSFNLSNVVAMVLGEGLRQLG